MNTVSIILAVIVLLIIIGAVYGCYRTMRAKDCCGSNRGTEATETVANCSVKKGN